MPPIGSTKYRYYQFFGVYLNPGTGEACAGQSKANWTPVKTLYDPKVSELVENFGAADPIGSTQNREKFPCNSMNLIIAFVLLQPGMGTPYAGKRAVSQPITNVLKGNQEQYWQFYLVYLNASYLKEGSGEP